MSENTHTGHRQRLKDRFLREGLDGFEKHNVLELLLFYAIPQKDTNPIAHRLIDRFGSLGGVFSASIEELCKIEGISEHSATLIKMVPAVYRASVTEVKTGERYDSLNKIGRLLVKYYAGVTNERIYLVLLDNDYHIISVEKVGDGAVNNVSVDTRTLISAAIKYNAAMVVLAHNHPGGNLAPSSEDISTTARVRQAFSNIRVELLEHLLVAGESFEPLLSKTEGIFWHKGDTPEFYSGK